MPNQQQQASADDGNGSDAPGAPHLGMPVAPASSVAGAGDKGVVVTAIDPDGPAAERGLQSGDVILDVAGKSVGSVGDLRKALVDAKSQGQARRADAREARRQHALRRDADRLIDKCCFAGGWRGQHRHGARRGLTTGPRREPAARFVSSRAAGLASFLAALKCGGLLGSLFFHPLVPARCFIKTQAGVIALYDQSSFFSFGRNSAKKSNGSLSSLSPSSFLTSFLILSPKVTIDDGNPIRTRGQGLPTPR